MTWNHTQPPSWFQKAVWNQPWSKRNGIHYVGDDIVLDWTWNGSNPNAQNRKVKTGFEWGTDGEVILVTDREMWTPYGGVDGTPRYDSTHTYRGNLSMKAESGQRVRLTLNGGTHEGYGRMYFYATQNPLVNVPIGWEQTGGITVRTDGRLSFGNYAEGLTAASIALNQWIRIEWYIHWGYPTQADSIFTLRLYNNADADIDGFTEEATVTNIFSQQANNQQRFGSYGTLDWGAPIWFDNVAAGYADWLGPYTRLEDQLAPNPLHYDILDYYGKNVSNGDVELGGVVFKPNTPAGGWKPGWYRVYLTGPQSTTEYLNSYGATNFCIIRDDPHFVAMPPGDTVGSTQYDDLVMKGVMGLGTSRLSIFDVLNSAELDNAVIDAARVATYWYAIPDAERPAREGWCQLANRTADYLWVHRLGGQSWERWLSIYQKTLALNPANIYITIDAGTNPDTDRVRVYYPDAATLVETWDNLASASAAQTAINAGSNYIKVFAGSGRADIPVAQTAIGSAYHDAMVNIVSTLYAEGITRFEGPYNEPPGNAETVHQMMLFQDAVHEGNANAKAIGPCPVELGQLPGFFAAGGGAYCDEISFHAYNAVTNGDMNLGKNILQTQLADVLATYGLTGKPLWQTESVGLMCPVYGIYHPRRSRKPLMEWLLFERYNTPRERNCWWYDVSHGFWDVPAWIADGDSSLAPGAVLARVLAEETWGKPYDSWLNCGTLGNAMFLAHLYEGTSGKCVVLMATSYMTGASITLTVTGAAGPFTVVDGFGNERVVPLSKGRLTVSLTDVPSYVRLPSAASVSVYRVNNHSPLGNSPSISPSATTKQIDGTTYSVIADNGYLTNYGAQIGAAPNPGLPAIPGYTTLIWDNPTTIDRVIVWCEAWQQHGTLIDFDIETYDGATWTVRKTVTKPDPPWFEFSTSNWTTNCFEETYWDEQWIHDVQLDAPVTCRGVRLYVRQASYGGEPLSDADIAHGQGGGQGLNVQGYRIQEIAVVDSYRYAGAI